MAVAPASVAAATADPPLAFVGVPLGTSEAAWRALKPPGPIPAHARRLCSDDPAGAAAGLKPDGPGAVVCGAVDDYGKIAVPVAFTWQGKYPLEQLRFVFVGGRLSEIRAQLPADAFDDVMARLDRVYGPATHEVRDDLRTKIGRIPRVTETWVRAAGRIDLVDPAVPGKLSLRITASKAATPA